jgi:hypothetical protein
MKKRKFKKNTIEFICLSDHANSFGDNCFEVWLSYKPKDIKKGQVVIIERENYDIKAEIMEIDNNGDTIFIKEI